MKQRIMNTVRTLIISALVACYQPLSAQIKNSGDGLVGNGKIVSEERTLEPYDRLLVDFAVKVRITRGDPTKAELEGEQNVLPYVTVSVNKGELTIGLSRTTKFKETKSVTVTIHQATLQAIKAKTACAITSDLPINSEQLTVTLDEACTLTTPLAVQQLTVDLAAASSVAFQGKTQTAVLRLDAASRVAAADLTIAKAELSLYGASHAFIHVTETLSASADGVSTIKYSGNPTVTSQRATGLSKIKHTD
jgi:hypothetical protein